MLRVLCDLGIQSTSHMEVDLVLGITLTGLYLTVISHRLMDNLSAVCELQLG